MSDLMIDMRKIKKRYDKNTTILYENLQVYKKGLTIIRGQSGSGKSTLFNIISGIDRDIAYESGSSLLVNNINFLTAKNREILEFRRNNIGFIFQDYELLRDFTVEENIKIYNSFNKINTDETDRYIRDFFTEIDDIKSFKSKKPSQLSGGQQQRVALIRAIIHKPSLILADEPTSNIDKDTEETILKEIGELSKEKCVILITHKENISKHLKNVKPTIYEIKKRGDGFILNGKS